MKYQSHLCLGEVDLPPSGEWQPPVPCWCLIQVEQGQGYWLGQGENRELNPGDVLVASPTGKGLFRASQLTTVRLQHFRFCPELMSGLLSLAERQQFEKLAAKGQFTTRLLPESHALAKRFADLCAQPDGVSGFLQRCRMLELVGAVFNRDFSPVSRAESSSALSATKRIKVLLEHLTEEEFLNASAEELAAYCGCSLRHFSRLFLHHFGVSLRSRQTEMRLTKARRLLTETDSRVMTVAGSCGYRHLGVFNALFKKRFGMTPTAWRRESVRGLPRPLNCVPVPAEDAVKAKAEKRHRNGRLS